MKLHKTLYFCALSLTILRLSAQPQTSVSFEKWLSLRSAGGVALSPDGAFAAYTVSTTDWKENSYDNEIWIAQKGQEPFQLTRTAKGSSNSPKWSPDSKWLAFLADRGDKSQIYCISIHGGEAFPLTKEEDGVNNFSWSPDGIHIAFTKNDPESKTLKSTKDKYGAWAVEGEEYKLSHLWLIPVDFDSIPKPERLTEGNFTVTGFYWSPDGKHIAYDRQPDPLINSSIHSDIALLDLASKTSTPLITNPSSDDFLAWSPEGDKFIYASNVNDTTSNYYTNNRLFIYDMTGHSSREIATDFDEDKYVSSWNKKGIFFTASQKTKAGLFQLDPVNGGIQQLSLPVDIVNNTSYTKDGSVMAYTGRTFDGLSEVYIDNEKLTGMSDQLKGWNTPVNEVIQWKSKDGALIEGILLKPRNFDPQKKYPLLVVIHGGPTGVDRPDPTPTYVYPIIQWCEKGAIVLRVNYRGSAGYGSKFRSLNVRNLGVGDMWDVVSGVDYLAKKGFVDTSRMGCMGWSQGGYISAFLTTHTHIFKAISVGAGISDWETYYVSTDITPFTRQYLKATPWEDRAIYEKTSPMAAINQASTPTQIQHGELDTRVPVSDAHELYRGLQDRKIPSRLIIYKGFGHGITRPKERLAAIWHNWQWFGKYIWGEEITIPVEK